LVLWEWPHDRPFLRHLLHCARAVGVHVEPVGPAAVAACLRRLSRPGAVLPRLVLDRASDVLPEAAALVVLLRRRGVIVVNDPDRTTAAADKAHMHLALMAHGVHVPWTLVLPPLAEGQAVALDGLHGLLQGLHHVGTPFVVKPAHGGGGEGVVTDATTHDDIAAARAQWVEDSYLVQERIVPREVGGQVAWFRVLHCLGAVFPCFWHPQTSHYVPLSAEQEASEWGSELQRVTGLIARASGMALFSTEIALTGDGKLVAVDYVNDMLDLRPQSGAVGGVPDAIVAAIADRLVRAAVDLAGSRR
jgi:hypothetical protein